MRAHPEVSGELKLGRRVWGRNIIDGWIREEGIDFVIQVFLC